MPIILGSVKERREAKKAKKLEANRRYAAANPGKNTEWSRACRDRQRAEDPEGFKASVNEKARRYRAKNLETMRKKGRERERFRRYGLTQEQIDAMLAAQGGVCAICKSDHPGNKRAWHVDHDHETKVVRAILCHPCNVMLGVAKDSPANLLAGAAYLIAHGK